jgi:metacaspase-1
MPTGRALTIGLNAVDPSHYGGWSGELNACEADAEDMASIASLDATTLLTQNATRDRVIAEIGKAAKKLKSGDLFLLTYSGHGGQLPDLNSDEDDSQDETWCLYDGEFVDDELYFHLSKFAKGVRLLVFSDSCHSGTVVKMAFYHGAASTKGIGASNGVKFRNMPPGAALRTYRKNRSFYDKILKDTKLKNADSKVKASVMLISGCMDNQLSADGDFNGLFTSNLLRVWNNGKFKGNYRAFHKAILGRMPPDQTPNYFRIGPANSAFEAQKPFTV